MKNSPFRIFAARGGGGPVVGNVDDMGGGVRRGRRAAAAVEALAHGAGAAPVPQFPSRTARRSIVPVG